MSPFPAAARPKTGLVAGALLASLVVTGAVTAGSGADTSATATGITGADVRPVAATVTTSTAVATTWRDTMVSRLRPTTTFGNVSALELNPDTQGLLSFHTPVVPTGAQVTAVRLCLTPTVTASTAVVAFTAPDAWSTATTWLTRPPLETTRSGSTSTTLVAGRRACLPVPVSQLERGDTEFRLASSSQPVKVASREAGTTAAPSLAVTYAVTSATSTSTAPAPVPSPAPTTPTPTRSDADPDADADSDSDSGSDGSGVVER